MQSIQTSHLFSLSGVKPLEELFSYRDYCLSATQKALGGQTIRRRFSACHGKELKKWKRVKEFEYLCCEECGSFFLADLPSLDVWAALLSQISQCRYSSSVFHQNIKESRDENVLRPKCEWVENVLRIHNKQKVSILEVVTPPSDIASLLQKCSSFGEVFTGDETLLLKEETIKSSAFHGALLLESLDRAYDPQRLLEGVTQRLKNGGLLFVTALVASGFDMTVLKEQNAYLFPPDRTNCFSLKGLEALLKRFGFELLEVSTPGLLDVEIVKAHLKQGTKVSLSVFEQNVLHANQKVCDDFQSFLQQSGMSSFARIVAKKEV